MLFGFGIPFASIKCQYEVSVMNAATAERAAGASLTRVDVLLCVLPIALFLSIVSLV